MNNKSKRKAQSLTPAQRNNLNTQLKQVIQEIQRGNVSAVGSKVLQLTRKYPGLGEVQHVACGYYTMKGELQRAMYSAEQAVQCDPGQAGYHTSLGILYTQIGETQKAIDTLTKAIEINPMVPQAQGALGIAFAKIGEIKKARFAYEQAYRDHPQDYEPRMNHALLESDVGNAHRASEMIKELLVEFPENVALHDSLCMFATYDDQQPPHEVFEIHRAYGESLNRQVRPMTRYPNSTDPDRKIKLGFISPDLKAHSISYFIEPLIKHFDRDRFEVFLYTTSRSSDQTTERLKSLSDHWSECFDGIPGSIKQIRDDQIDVLFEISGHFAANLLPLFASRPAPVSISAIGYANTSGLDRIDARIVDEITDPTGSADELATEQLVRVDDGFLCYQPPADAPGCTLDDSDSSFVFGSFNDLRKMSPSVLDAWGEILKQVPDSKLMIKTKMLAFPEMIEEFESRMESRGIDRDRLILLGRTESLQDHLALYNRMDCSLDTFPYAGTTTSCEAIYMGVPVVTLQTQAHAGRVGASLLNSVRRPQDIAIDKESYIKIACDYARSGKRSSKDRALIRAQLMGSSLVDQTGYTKKFESVITQLWTTWCEQGGSK